MRYPAVREWLLRHTPLEPTLLEGQGFESLVGERIEHTAGSCESSYITALERQPDEVDRLTGGIAVPETWFFRYPQSYALLEERLRRRLREGAQPIRIASVACATGEEPYSVAMVARHIGAPEGTISIDAYDRNQAFIRSARAGVYGPSSIRSEIPAWSGAYLIRSGEALRVDPDTQRLVRFECLDATAPGPVPPGPACDIIFCRNLLIYLNADARRRLLDALVDSLVPDGLLFLGHAEPLLSARPGLRPAPGAHTFCMEKCDVPQSAPRRDPAPSARTPDASPVRVLRPTLEPRPALRAPSAPPVASPERPTIDHARTLADAGRTRESEDMLRALLAKNGPSADVLELLGAILMVQNQTTAARKCFEQAIYLEPGRAASILQLAMIYEKSGDTARAAACWDRARRAAAGNAPESRS